MLKFPQIGGQAASVAEARPSMACHATPLGPLFSWWTERGLYRLSWQRPEDRSAPAASALLRRSEDDDAPSPSPPLADFHELLQAFFAGEPAPLDGVPIDSQGWTPFFAEVYRACRQIPAGQTRGYAELAAAVGRPRAVRAVGQAMARNRIPIVIPCHRVVGSDGRLRGFSAPGGLRTKQLLLDLERTGH